MNLDDDPRLVLLCFHLMEAGSPGAGLAAEELRRRNALWLAGTTFAVWSELCAEELDEQLARLRLEGVELALADVEGGLDGLAGELGTPPEALEDDEWLSATGPLPGDAETWDEVLAVYESILTTGLPPED